MDEFQNLRLELLRIAMDKLLPEARIYNYVDFTESAEKYVLTGKWPDGKSRGSSTGDVKPSAYTGAPRNIL